MMLGMASAHAAAPASSTVTYNLFRNGLQLGVITERFEARDGKYQATSEGRATGLLALAQREPIRYLSVGKVTGEGLKPERFEGRQSGKFVLAEFDWLGSKLTLTHDGLNHAMALPANAQDRLSIMYQIHYSLASKAKEMDFAMTTGRKLERYRYVATPNVTIDTPFKRLNTVHLVKQRENDEDTQTEIWVAPDYGNIAARVLIVESDGVKYEQVATYIMVRP